MKHTIYILLGVLLVLSPLRADPTGNLQVTANVYTIQERADYTFLLLLTGDPATTYTVPIGSNLIINMPAEYPLFPADDRVCSILAWPTSYGPITCTLSYSQLIIANAFTFPLVIRPRTAYTLNWYVKGIQNPTYSLNTGYFSGVIKYNNAAVFAMFLPSNRMGLSIQPGSLSVQLSVWPTAADGNSNLTIVVKPTHFIPAAGCLKITFSSTWSTSYNQNNILGQTSQCVAINNTKSNLDCGSLTPQPPNYIITVVNLYDSPSADQLIFNLTNFVNPPSGEPIGNFIVQSFNSTDDYAAMIDNSTGNDIRGITASPILLPSLTLSQYQQGAAVNATLTLTIVNVIQPTDFIYFQAPTQIDLSTVKKVQLAGSDATVVSTNTSQVKFQPQSILNNPYPLSIKLSNITLPSYATVVSSPFKLYVLRNGFEVCKMEQGFGISIAGGDLGVLLAGNDTQAGIAASYNFSLSFSHPISPTHKLSFSFNPSYFTLTSAVTCQSSTASTPTILSNSNNLIELQGLVLTTSSAINLILNNIVNPSLVGFFPAISIYTYINIDGNFYMVDYNQVDAYFNVTARAMAYQDFNVTAASYVAYALTTYTLAIRNNNALMANSYLNIYFPSEVLPDSATCNVSCNSATINGKKTVRLLNIGPLPAGTTSFYTIGNVLNPISNKTSSPFSLQIYSQANKLLEYLSNGRPIKATTASNLSILITPPSKVNSAACNYSISLATNYPINATVALILVMPSVQGCPTCTATAINATHTQFVFYNNVMTTNALVFTVPDFSNYDNTEPQNISAALFSNDLNYIYANGNTQISTNAASNPSFVYNFTTYELYTFTNLIISNFTSATLPARVQSIVLIFPTDFDITALDCTNVGYTCTINSSEVTLSVVRAGVMPQINLKNIRSPSYPGLSTSIQLSTYSSIFLIDRNAVIRWQPNCLPPCRTCTANISYCLSCYSNATTALGSIFYSSLTNSCVSLCGDLYYKNYSTNICERCSSACANCYNGNFCYSCPGTLYLLNQRCYDLCPNGYFPHGVQCLPCTPSRHCYTCDNEKSCSSCDSPYFYYQSACTLICPENVTIENATSYVCDGCPTNCSACVLNGTAVVCTACVSGLLDANRCVQSCITKFYVPDGKVCSPCGVLCKSCTTAPDICESCFPNSSRPYLLNSSCYDQCVAGFYNDNATYSCQKCQPPCETCNSFSTNDCKTCIAGYSLIGSICKPLCPDKYYSNGTNCPLCISHCLTCMSDSLCLSCAMGYLYYSSNYSCLDICPPGSANVSGVCQPCSGCLTCSAQTTCLTCPPNSYLFGSSCVNACPGNYFAKDGSCAPCPAGCSQCNNSTYCTSCSGSYQLQGNSCVNRCLSDQIPSNGVCVNCSTGCSGCQSSPNNCTGCVNGYLYAASLYRCFTVCPAQLYFDGLSNACIVVCPSNTYVTKNATNNVSSCNSCPQYCSLCLSATFCTACLTGTFFYNNTCDTSCRFPAAYAFNSICQSCNVVDCQICWGQNCSACSSGKLLIGSSLCISNCSNNQVYNAANKTCDTIVPVINNTVIQNNNVTGNKTDKGVNNATNSANIAVDAAISFLPLPFFIVLLLSAVLIFILHFRNKLNAIPTLYGLIGPLIFFSSITIILLGLIQGQTLLSHLSVYTLILADSLSLIAGIVSLLFWRKYCGSEKWGVLVLALVHYSAVALLTANFSQYNSYFKEEHRSFWRRYKIVSKVNLATFFSSGVAGTLMCFGITNKSSYLFFAGVEMSLLAVVGLILAILWIWIPLKPPVLQQQSISEKSTEIIMGSEVDKYSEKEPSGRNKSRGDQIKTDGDNLSVDGRQKVTVKSNYEYNQIESVLKIEKERIAQALDQGLFRKEEGQMLSQMRHSQELNHLDDALEMNKYLNEGEIKQGVTSHGRSKKEANIFQKEETQFSEGGGPSPRNSVSDEDYLPEINEKEMFRPNEKTPVQKKPTDKDSDQASGQMALYQQPLPIKEFDFQHNIIFEDIEEDNITEYRQQKSDSSQAALKPLIKDSSLGVIINKQPQVLKVERNDNASERGFSPMFERGESKLASKLTVEQVQDQFLESRIQLFNEQSKLKPAFSRQLRKKSLIQPQFSKEISKMPKQTRKKEKNIKEEAVIHADLQQILTVEDAGSLQYLDFDQFAENEREGGSSRKLKNEKVEGDYVMREKSVPRPGEFFRHAAVHYQPSVEKNVAPEQKDKRRTGRGRNN